MLVNVKAGAQKCHKMATNCSSQLHKMASFNVPRWKGPPPGTFCCPEREREAPLKCVQPRTQMSICQGPFAANVGSVQLHSNVNPSITKDRGRKVLLRSDRRVPKIQMAKASIFTASPSTSQSPESNRSKRRALKAADAVKFQCKFFLLLKWPPPLEWCEGESSLSQDMRL